MNNTNKIYVDYLTKNAKKYNILIVEDDITALNNLVEISSKFFNHVYKAENAEKALDILNKEKIDLILTDINMPKKNGLEFIEEVRKKDKDISIIIISAYNDDEFFQKAIEEDVDGYILKPLNINHFLKILVKSIKNIINKEERNRYFNLLKQYEEIVDESAIFAKVDKERKIIYANEELVKLTGYSKEELLNKDYRNFIELNENMFNFLREQIVENKSIFKGVLKLKTKDNDIKFVKFVVKPIIVNDEIEEFLVVGYDISLIMNHKKLLLDEIEKSNNPYLALFKIANYKDVVSFFGEKISEDFEKQILKYIKNICSMKKIFLLDNAEIAIFYDGIDMDFETFKNKIISILNLLNTKEVKIDGVSYDIFLVVSFSNGKNCFEDCRIGLEKIKKLKSTYVDATNFLSSEKEKAKNNLKTLMIIKNAINEKNVFCVYQPIVNNKTLKIEKYEALVRIKHNDNVLSPSQFLEVAKKSSFYSVITQIVLEKSLELLEKIEDEISVNISSIDIEKLETREKFLSFLDSNPSISHKLTVELLESERIENDEKIKKFILDIKNRGVKIAIDDFGRGYSNFIRLLKYVPDFIKIDGDIIKEITINDYAYNVSKIIVKFAKENNIKVIAEFVENEEIFNKVKELGIDYSQGYYFSKPIII